MELALVGRIEVLLIQSTDKLNRQENKKKKETEKITISVCITLLMTAPSNPYFYKVPQRKPLVATHPICIRPPSPSNKKAMVGCSHKCPCPSKTWAATGAKTICALLRSIFFRTQF